MNNLDTAIRLQGLHELSKAHRIQAYQGLRDAIVDEYEIVKKLDEAFLLLTDEEKKIISKELMDQ